MLEPDELLPSFLDELEKIAASFSRLSVAKSRSGRRPISVSNFLKKDKDGTLFRKHGTSLVSPPLVTPVEKIKKKKEPPVAVDVGDSPNRVPGTGWGV